ncbi:hypothetical protein ACFVXQ_13085 [Kitasatospora sp. NPDC058263]
MVLLPYAAVAGLVVPGVLLALRPWWAAALAGLLATGLTDTHAGLGRAVRPPGRRTMRTSRAYRR